MEDIDKTRPPLDNLQVPTLTGVAPTVAQCGGPQMDEEQCIVYEVMCWNFILGLINDSQDDNSLLGYHLQQALSNNSDKE